jgi:hypothetical protein
MAKCDVCRREMTNPRTIGCDPVRRLQLVPLIVSEDTGDPEGPVPGKLYDPVPFKAGGGRERCPDCNCLQGSLHHLSCFAEECPCCGGQLLTCTCFDSVFEQFFGDEEDDEA